MRSAAPSRMIDGVNTETQHSTASQHSTAWGRAFPVVYDPFLWFGERAGVRTLRKELLGGARGCTVEIGSGTGLNLPHYADDVAELIVAEPDPSMRSRLEQRVARRAGPARVIDAPAERLPFPDGSIDTVVSTFVLCTVDDPDAALQEIARVLRPDGQLLFIEHVRAESPTLAAWQQRLAEPWRRFARGCRCDRETAALIANSGLTLDDVQEGSWRAMPPIVRPLIAGRARRSRR
jgi:ubiquinone/menaquinone biosynthesis C-methylase UbiE